MTSRSGFTLVEMMAAVAIISILGTMAAIRYAGSVKKAQSAECVATRYIVTDAENRFAVEHEGRGSKSLEELRDAGYMQALPVCKAGGTFAWVMNAAGSAGRHLACSLHGDAMPDAPPTIPGTPPGSGKPPASAADCPAGTDYIHIYDAVHSNYVFVCAPKCPPGQLHHPTSGVCLTPVRPHSPPAHFCPRMWKWDAASNGCTPQASSAAAVSRIMDMPRECDGGRTWDKASSQCK